MVLEFFFRLFWSSLYWHSSFCSCVHSQSARVSRGKRRWPVIPYRVQQARHAWTCLQWDVQRMNPMSHVPHSDGSRALELWAVSEARCHFLSQKARSRAELSDVLSGRKKKENGVDYYYYSYLFICFSCHSDSSFLTHSVLSHFFMSDVSVQSIPTSLKMEFIKKGNEEGHLNCLQRLWSVTDDTLMQRIIQVQVFALHQP